MLEETEISVRSGEGHCDTVIHNKKYTFGSSHCEAVETNLTRNHEDAGLIPGLTQWVKDPALSCGVGHRHGSDPLLLWLWCRLL